MPINSENSTCGGVNRPAIRFLELHEDGAKPSVCLLEWKGIRTQLLGLLRRMRLSMPLNEIESICVTPSGTF
jgi:hypothetical protein